MAAKSRLRAVLLLALVTAALAGSLIGRRSMGHSVALSPAPPDVLRLGQLRLEPCMIGRANAGIATVRAYCAAVPVPENRRAANGRQLHLKVAVVAAESEQAEADLIVFLDGGPGGAATEDYPALASAFAPLRKRHAVLLIDQRGTGGSNSLDCADQDDTSAAPNLEQLRQCLRKLASRAAPEFYTTSDAVEDLEAVRLALGSPPLDLIGVSYGTRVAQQYARKYGKAVRAMVLDGAVPNSLALGSEHAANLEAVLRDLSARCRARVACTARYGDPYQTLQRVQARLRKAPQKLNAARSLHLSDPGKDDERRCAGATGADLHLQPLYGRAAAFRPAAGRSRRVRAAPGPGAGGGRRCVRGSLERCGALGQLCGRRGSLARCAIGRRYGARQQPDQRAAHRLPAVAPRRAPEGFRSNRCAVRSRCWCWPAIRIR